MPFRSTAVLSTSISPWSSTLQQYRLVAPSAVIFPSRRSRPTASIDRSAGSPYLPVADRDNEWQRVSGEMTQHQVDLVFLNCMRMNEQMKSTVQQGTGKPVLLLSSMLARMIAELVH